MYPKKEITTKLTESGCHEVTSHALHTQGYPVAYLPYYSPEGPRRIRRKQMCIHRYIFAKHNGPIPPGMHVMHTCDNRLCINPSHLKLGTHQDNMADMVAKGRNTKGDTCGRSKIKSETVNQILSEPNLTQLQIAEKYGISRSHVSRIRSGKTWKHIQRIAN
jgi:predicted XRE-type DNA-binding protein